MARNHQMQEYGVGERIKVYREIIGLKGYQFAEQIGISQGSLSDIENNNALPSADTLIRIHRTTTVNIIWVLTDQGSMIRLEGKDLTTPLTKLINRLSKIYYESESMVINQIKRHFKDIEDRK